MVRAGRVSYIPGKIRYSSAIFKSIKWILDEVKIPKKQKLPLRFSDELKNIFQNTGGSLAQKRTYIKEIRYARLNYRRRYFWHKWISRKLWRRRRKIKIRYNLGKKITLKKGKRLNLKKKIKRNPKRRKRRKKFKRSLKSSLIRKRKRRTKIKRRRRIWQIKKMGRQLRKKLKRLRKKKLKFEWTQEYYLYMREYTIKYHIFETRSKAQAKKNRKFYDNCRLFHPYNFIDFYYHTPKKFTKRKKRRYLYVRSKRYKLRKFYHKIWKKRIIKWNKNLYYTLRKYKRKKRRKLRIIKKITRKSKKIIFPTTKEIREIQKKSWKRLILNEKYYNPILKI